LGTKFKIVWQLAKFGVTGVMNFLVDLGVLSILIFISQDYFQVETKKTILSLGFVILTFYSIYKAISFILASFNSYFWNKFWTFEKKSTEKTGKEFTQFFIVSLVGFILNVLVASYVFKSIDFSGLTSNQWGLVGAAAGSIVGLTWNFLGYKFIVFKK
jgi:putative flippase GtrA